MLQSFARAHAHTYTHTLSVLGSNQTGDLLIISVSAVLLLVKASAGLLQNGPLHPNTSQLDFTFLHFHGSD